ncbi:MAG: RNA-binding protein [Halocynthiibacter sp.]
MPRGGRERHMKREAPERRCVVTGETQPKAGLIRFVVGPDDTIMPDVLGKLPGRGIYVASDLDVLAKATKGGFSKGAKQAVKVPENLIDMVDKVLARRVVDLISIARKAGKAVTGYEKVKNWMATEQASVLFQASDGSERGKSKIRAPQDPNKYIGMLSAEELGLAFGRENVIHGALAAGGLTDRVVEDAVKLGGIRKSNGGDAHLKGTKTS